MLVFDYAGLPCRVAAGFRQPDPRWPGRCLRSTSMKMTFAMVARSLFGARLKDEDINLVSDTIGFDSGIHCPADAATLSESLFAVSREKLHKHDDMRHTCRRGSARIHQETPPEPPGHDLLQTSGMRRYRNGKGTGGELVLSENMQLLVAGHENVVRTGYLSQPAYLSRPARILIGWKGYGRSSIPCWAMRGCRCIKTFSRLNTRHR